MNPKPFKPLTDAEQRKAYNKKLKLWAQREIKKIAAKYRAKRKCFGSGYGYYEKLVALSKQIGKKQDRIANAADKEFGTWKWRHNPKLMKRVWLRMEEATAKETAKVAALEEKMARLKAEEVAERRAVVRKLGLLTEPGD